MKLPKWEKAGNDGEIEIAFPTRKFRLEKQYDRNDRHKGEWRILEWDKDYKRWEWYETYSPKYHAKQQVMKMGEYDNKGKKITEDIQMDELDILIEAIDPRIINKIKDDQKKRFFKKALERMHKMVQKDDGKSSIGNIAFEITRQVQTGLTSREFEKAYKQVYGIKEDAPTNSVAGGGVSLPPDARFKPINVTDQRRRKDKPPVMLKRFKGFSEATYKGKEVTLNKPTAGDVAKSKVYVDVDGDGKATKVNFGHGGTSAKKAGEKTMRIRKDNPEARKSFRARHNCDDPGPKDKARYWSCKAW